jgi:hypothetical protein
MHAYQKEPSEEYRKASIPPPGQKLTLKKMHLSPRTTHNPMEPASIDATYNYTGFKA